MSRFERWNLWISTLVVIVTGVALGLVKYLMVPEDPWAAINHPVQPWLLKAHIVAAPFLVFAVGTITLRHIWRHYRSGQSTGRRSGVTTMLVTLPMILSGYLIQVVTEAGWLRAMVIAHLVFGTLYALGLSIHQFAIGRNKAADTVSNLPPRSSLEDRVILSGRDEGR